MWAKICVHVDINPGGLLPFACLAECIYGTAARPSPPVFGDKFPGVIGEMKSTEFCQQE